MDFIHLAYGRETLILPRFPLLSPTLPSLTSSP